MHPFEPQVVLRTDADSAVSLTAGHIPPGPATTGRTVSPPHEGRLRFTRTGTVVFGGVTSSAAYVGGQVGVPAGTTVAWTIADAVPAAAKVIVALAQPVSRRAWASWCPAESSPATPG